MGKLGGAYECEISDECWMQMVSQPEGTNFHRASSGDGYIAVHAEGHATFIPFQSTAISLSDRVHTDETLISDAIERHIRAEVIDMRQQLLMADPDETEGVE